MEKNKIGKFLIQLRKEKNLTQYDVADMIPISREAVSKWERGLTKPNKSSLEKLSQIFNVSVEEILLGKKINKNRKQELQKLTLELYGSKLILKRIIIILFLFIILIITLFLSYYFFTNYNSIKVYTLNNSNDSTIINDGILVITKENIYFNINNIQTEFPILMLKLYYKDNKSNNLIYSTEDNFINLYDYYGYNAYFEYEKIDDIIKNLYLEIDYGENGKENIKLNFIKDFANNKFFNNKENNIIEQENYNDKIELEKIKNTFEQKDGIFIYNDKKNNLTFSYIEEANLLNLISDSKSMSFEWYYYFDSKTLEYNEYQNQKLVNSFNYYDNDIVCNIENCVEDKEKIKYFYDSLNTILE